MTSFPQREGPRRASAALSLRSGRLQTRHLDARRAQPEDAPLGGRHSGNGQHDLDLVRQGVTRCSRWACTLRAEA
jgi:hypothetical protein